MSLTTTKSSRSSLPPSVLCTGRRRIVLDAVAALTEMNTTIYDREAAGDGWRRTHMAMNVRDRGNRPACSSRLVPRTTAEAADDHISEFRHVLGRLIDVIAAGEGDHVRKKENEESQGYHEVCKRIGGQHRWGITRIKNSIGTSVAIIQDREPRHGW